MGKHISLQDAKTLMETLPIEQAMNHPDLLQFCEDIEDAGMETLSRLDAEYLATAIGLMMSTAVVNTCQNEDGSVDLLKMLRLHGLTQNEDFQDIMMYAFKYVIGLSVIEELR